MHIAALRDRDDAIFRGALEIQQRHDTAVDPAIGEMRSRNSGILDTVE